MILKNKEIWDWILISFIGLDIILSSYFSIRYFHMPSWLFESRRTHILEQYGLLRELFQYLSLICSVIVLVKFFKEKRINWSKWLLFPMIYMVTRFVFERFTKLIIHEPLDEFGKPFEMDGIQLLIFVFYVLFNLYVIFYFLSNLASKNDNYRLVKVSRWSRLWNYLFDYVFIIFLMIPIFFRISDGWIFSGVDFMEDSPVFILSWYILLYYLVIEYVFSTTMGKLHNGSIVHYEENRYTHSLLRTLCRLIPFEIFSFFGTEGWHDRFSKTSVVVKKKVEE